MIKTLGYIMSATGGAMLYPLLVEYRDWKIAAAYFIGGFGAVIIGACND